MRVATSVLGLLLVLTGIVWSLQGVGVLGGSFMTGQREWLVIGLACLAGGCAVLAGGRWLRRG